MHNGNMENYDLNISEGIHTIRTTVQVQNYKGTIITKMGGNCHGLAILQTIDPFNEDFEGTDNDCDLQYDEDYQTFTMRLRNDVGDILEVTVDDEEFADMIVAVEIIGYVERGEESV